MQIVKAKNENGSKALIALETRILQKNALYAHFIQLPDTEKPYEKELDILVLSISI